MKKKMTILTLVLCAVMIALHIVLEMFLTFRIGNTIKVSFSSLPFLVLAFLCGPVEGMVAGLIGSFLSQLLTFGITQTTVFWIIPFALEALVAGLVYIAFKRQTKILPIAVSVFAGGLVAVIFNLIGSYFDGVVFFKYLTVEALIALIPIRLAKWAVISVIYTIILVPVTKALQKSCPAGYRNAKKKVETA